MQKRELNVDHHKQGKIFDHVYKQKDGEDYADNHLDGKGDEIQICGYNDRGDEGSENYYVNEYSAQ